MTKISRATLMAGVALALATPSPQDVAQANDRNRSIRADLRGIEEPPSVSSTGTGEFRAKISRDETSFEYELTFEDLEGDVTQSHIHIAQKGVNGGISIWLCGTGAPGTPLAGPPGTPLCGGPREGTVTRTVTAADVIGPADPAAVARAVALARKSDVVVLCLGTSLQVEAEGRDRRDLNLPGAQQALLEAVFAANSRIALVLFNAGPLAVTWAHDQLPAIMAAWYPGEAGGLAVARALFGVDNPGGKLPYTVYANLDGVPPQNEYDVSKGYTYQYFRGVPLYPFGFGLSYTRFRFSNLTLSASSIAATGEVQVAFDITIVGDRAGDEVAQLYTHQPRSRSYQPLRTLRAFRRLTLEPKQTTHVTFTLPASQLAWYQGGTIGSAVSGQTPRACSSGSPLSPAPPDPAPPESAPPSGCSRRR